MIEMLGQNGLLTALGVGIAVVFLLVMVSRVSARNKAARADEDAVAGQEAEPSSLTAGPVNDKGVVAAIAAAVNEYRKNNT